MDWHNLHSEEVLKAQEVGASQGLTQAQAEARQSQYGKNELVHGKKRGLFAMALEQLQDFMVIVLIAAAVLSALLGEVADAAVILLVVALNAVMGVVQEFRAEQSLEKLKQMSSPHARVVRGGAPMEVEAQELVPGDIVLLEAGDLVPADIRLVEVKDLQAQESALTGESQPIPKETRPMPEKCALGDMRNMAFSGSLITYGRGTGVVVATGMDTQIGHIARMLEEEEGVATPLKTRLTDLGKKLGIASILICLVIFVVGLLYGREPLLMFMTAVSLAVAAIPEGLPATVTIVLAVGIKRMIARKAIVRRLPAVETLGSASVICSDKTGTLTLNKMTVTMAALPFEPLPAGQAKAAPGFRHLGAGAVLCSDVLRAEGAFMGDPTEVAIAEFAFAQGLERVRLEKQMPRVDEIPFDSKRKRMSTLNRGPEGFEVHVKGAVDAMLPLITRVFEGGGIRPITQADKARILAGAEAMAAQALRVIGFAGKPAAGRAGGNKEQAYESDLVFYAMVGMIDPPRPEAKRAVEICRRAGMKPVMITGDHGITAAAIARELGILGEQDQVVTGDMLAAMDDAELARRAKDISVYARVSPEHKVRIVKAWQASGNIVAMTGDGVNDAPALKRADIGVAMGMSGTEVAKEAAAMVITDDNFATIVAAVEEGRTVYLNILKVVQYLLSCNLAEILSLLVATIFNWVSPLLPIHILWVNLVTDSLPALALGMEPAEPDVMNSPPRDREASFLSLPMVVRMVMQGTLIAFATLAAYALGLKSSVAVAQTMAFSVLSFSQLVHVFNQRSNHLSLFAMGFHTNRWLILALIASAALQVGVLAIPSLREVFRLEMLSFVQWEVVALLSLTPMLAVELLKALRIHRQ